MAKIIKKILEENLSYDNTVILKYHIEYPYIDSGSYLSGVEKFNTYNKELALELKNKITAGEKYIVLSSTNLPKEILIDRFYVQGEEKDVYSVASSIITFKCEEHLLPYDIIRLKK